MSKNKVDYIKLCETETSVPIFMQSWWLDAVCNDGVSWDVALSRDKIGDISAALCFCKKRKWGFKKITMPHLTQFTGVWMKPLEHKNGHGNQSHQQEQLQQIVAQLPHCQHFTLRTHFNLTDWLPFYWAGFKQTTRYTYIIPNLSDLNLVFNNFEGNVKRAIRQAEGKYTIEQSDDFDLFLQLKNKNDNTPLSIWHNLNDILSKKQQKRLYFARNTEGVAEATAYIVWDNSTAYYLASGTTESGRKSQVMSLLLWQAMQDCAHHATVFDFEGSMLKTVEPYFRRFGTEQKAYFQLSKFSNKFIEMAFIRNGV